MKLRLRRGAGFVPERVRVAAQRPSDFVWKPCTEPSTNAHSAQTRAGETMMQAI